MPIHDQTYRRYAGKRDVAGRAWMVIARNGVLTIVRKRLFLGLLILSWLPFVVGAVLPQPISQHIRSGLHDLPDRFDTEPLEDLGGFGTHTPQGAHRQRREKVRFCAGRQDRARRCAGRVAGGFAGSRSRRSESLLVHL